MQRPLMGTTAGIEVEFNGSTDIVANTLADDGWCSNERHDYHCRCDTCNFEQGLLWRYQRDSSVSGGEFITRILRDWPQARLASEKLEAAIEGANRRVVEQAAASPPQPAYDTTTPEGRIMARLRLPAVTPTLVEVGQNTGLHVHVGVNSAIWENLVTSYLRWERYIQFLGAGPFPDKREGMNLTMLNALREQLRQAGHDPQAGRRLDWSRVSAMCRTQVAADRHVDLNHSRRNGTYEFRVFNATTLAWQMELAARLAIAFAKFSAQRDQPDNEQLILPAPALATVIPRLSIEQFCDHLVQFDPDLRPLLDRKLAESGEPEIPEVEEVVIQDEFDLEPLSPPGNIYDPPTRLGNARVMRRAGYRWDASEGMWRYRGRNAPPEPEPEPVDMTFADEVVEPRLRVADLPRGRPVGIIDQSLLNELRQGSITATITTTEEPWTFDVNAGRFIQIDPPREAF